MYTHIHTYRWTCAPYTCISITLAFFHAVARSHQIHLALSVARSGHTLHTVYPDHQYTGTASAHMPKLQLSVIIHLLSCSYINIGCYTLLTCNSLFIFIHSYKLTNASHVLISSRRHLTKTNDLNPTWFRLCTHVVVFL